MANVIRGYWKAFGGAAIAGLTTLGTALSDDRITRAEYVGILVAVLGVGGGVAKFKNTGPKAPKSNPQVVEVE